MPLPAEAAPSFLFIPELPPVGGTLALSREDAHYISRVCRARAGDVVSATDGRGTIARLRMTDVGARAAAEVESAERRERIRRAWVCCGAPEDDRADWLVEKLAELGIERFQPIDCERGAWRASSPRRARWERLAVAALRQSRQQWLMEVRDVAGLEVVAAEIPAEASRWLADPEGESALAADGPGLTVGMVGPAAGFSPGEKATLSTLGFKSLRLAGLRLRSETAAIAWSAWWASGAAESAGKPVNRPQP